MLHWFFSKKKKEYPNCEVRVLFVQTMYDS